MFSSGRDHSRGDHATRRTQFMREFQALDPNAPRIAVERLLARARALALDDADIAAELAELRGRIAAAAMRDRLDQRGLPVVAAIHPLPSGDRCHFVAPARFGRRRSDQCGHLALTSGWLRFHGALDLSVSWSEVERVARDGHELVIALRDSRRLLRFFCPTTEDAATAAVIATQLADDAHALLPDERPLGSTQPMQ